MVAIDVAGTAHGADEQYEQVVVDAFKASLKKLKISAKLVTISKNKMLITTILEKHFYLLTNDKAS